MSWKCFIVRPVSAVEVSLRRYSMEKCPLHPLGYHNASKVIGEEAYHGIWYGHADGGPPHDDPHWPLACDCDYIFKPDDNWLRHHDRIFEGMRGSELVRRAHKKLPPGAMWSVEPGSPLGGFRGPVGPDGLHWTLRLPGDTDFELYGPTSDGKFWQVTGVIPDITVHPSIDINSGHKSGYHGWVGSSNVPVGHVGEDVNGRRFDPEGVLLL